MCSWGGGLVGELWGSGGVIDKEGRKGTNAIKWKTSSSSVAVLCVSSTKGEDRAKEL